MKLGVSDVIEWNIDKDGIRLEHAEKPFLKFHKYFRPKSVRSMKIYRKRASFDPQDINEVDRAGYELSAVVPEES